MVGIDGTFLPRLLSLSPLPALYPRPTKEQSTHTDTNARKHTHTRSKMALSIQELSCCFPVKYILTTVIRKCAKMVQFKEKWHSDSKHSDIKFSLCTLHQLEIGQEHVSTVIG